MDTWQIVYSVTPLVSQILLENIPIKTNTLIMLKRKYNCPQDKDFFKSIITVSKPGHQFTDRVSPLKSSYCEVLIQNNFQNGYTLLLPSENLWVHASVRD